jgi:hypothetical protein
MQQLGGWILRSNERSIGDAKWKVVFLARFLLNVEDQDFGLSAVAQWLGIPWRHGEYSGGVVGVQVN